MGPETERRRKDGWSWIRSKEDATSGTGEKVMVYANIKTLKSIHTPPPFEMTIKGKKYGYLDDSTDFYAMDREQKQIKKQGQYYPIIVSFGIPKGETTIIKYALYVSPRGRGK